MEVIQYNLDNWQFKNKDEFLQAISSEMENVKKSFFTLKKSKYVV